MVRSVLSKIVPVLALVLGLSACASAPSRINNVWQVFDQKNGFFENWRTEAQRAERKRGVPVPVAHGHAARDPASSTTPKPPRTMVLGFIPWKRVSSGLATRRRWTAPGRNTSARPATVWPSATILPTPSTSVGWYHTKTAERFGVAKDDAYSLYLAPYYFGWAEAVRRLAG